ncbi:MAG: ImmA/IrrE family metallo-endopeptidase [Chloracidobacterium sp.]|nr:ImmA/IrrE family metallo-endopeptidase [Chloracidobacterium sp.]
MNLLVKRIEKLHSRWNVSALTAEDLYKLCSDHDIEVLEVPLRIDGFYYSVMGRHFIAVNSSLEPRRKLFVLFHEFAHFMFHAPTGSPSARFHGIGRRCRKEREADMFALCALIPKPMLESRSAADLIDGEGFPESMVLDRSELFKTHGI